MKTYRPLTSPHPPSHFTSPPITSHHFATTPSLRHEPLILSEKSGYTQLRTSCLYGRHRTNGRRIKHLPSPSITTQSTVSSWCLTQHPVIGKFLCLPSLSLYNTKKLPRSQPIVLHINNTMGTILSGATLKLKHFDRMHLTHFWRSACFALLLTYLLHIPGEICLLAIVDLTLCFSLHWSTRMTFETWLSQASHYNETDVLLPVDVLYISRERLSRTSKYCQAKFIV